MRVCVGMYHFISHRISFRTCFFFSCASKLCLLISVWIHTIKKKWLYTILHVVCNVQVKVEVRQRRRKKTQNNENVPHLSGVYWLWLHFKNHHFTPSRFRSFGVATFSFFLIMFFFSPPATSCHQSTAASTSVHISCINLIFPAVEQTNRWKYIYIYSCEALSHCQEEEEEEKKMVTHSFLWNAMNRAQYKILIYTRTFIYLSYETYRWNGTKKRRAKIILLLFYFNEPYKVNVIRRCVFFLPSQTENDWNCKI